MKYFVIEGHLFEYSEFVHNVGESGTYESWHLRMTEEQALIYKTMQKLHNLQIYRKKVFYIHEGEICRSYMKNSLTDNALGLFDFRKLSDFDPNAPITEESFTAIVILSAKLEEVKPIDRTTVAS